VALRRAQRKEGRRRQGQRTMPLVCAWARRAQSRVTRWEGGHTWPPPPHQPLFLSAPGVPGTPLHHRHQHVGVAPRARQQTPWTRSQTPCALRRTPWVHQGRALAGSWPGESLEHGISSSADAVPARLRTEEECQSQSQGAPQSLPPASPLAPTLKGTGAVPGWRGGATRACKVRGRHLEQRWGLSKVRQTGYTMRVLRALAWQKAGRGRRGRGTGGARRVCDKGCTSSAGEQQTEGEKEALLATLQHCSTEGLRILVNLAKAHPALAQHIPGAPTAGVPSTEASARAARAAQRRVRGRGH